MNMTDMLKVKFVYHQTSGCEDVLNLEVGETETVGDVTPRIIQNLWENQPNPQFDICLSRGYTIIEKDRTFQSERDAGHSLVYIVHVLPQVAFKCVMLTDKKGEHLVIVPRNCCVSDFRVQVARVLQVQEAMLQLLCGKGHAESTESENSDFLQNPIKIKRYQSGMIQIWMQRMLKDCPQKLKNVHVKIDSKKFRCTVTVTERNNTQKKSKHQMELSKFDNFAFIQRRIAEIHEVDFRLVELFDGQGKPVYKQFVFKKIKKLEATIWSEGRVVEVRTDDDKYTCVVKDADKVTGKDVRRAIELYHRKPNGAFKLAFGASLLNEESPMSSILTSCSEELVVHRNVESEQTWTPQSPTLGYSEESCSLRDQGETTPVQSERKRMRVAEETNRNKKRKFSSKMARTSHSRLHAQDPPASDGERMGENNRTEQCKKRKQDSSYIDEATAVRIHLPGDDDNTHDADLQEDCGGDVGRDKEHPRSQTQSQSASGSQESSTALMCTTPLCPLLFPWPCESCMMTNQQQSDETVNETIERTIETKTIQKGKRIVGRTVTMTEIDQAYRNDPSVSKLGNPLPAIQNEASHAPSLLEEPPEVIKDTMLMEIAGRLCHDWTSLCLSLGVPAAEIAHIEHNVKLLDKQAFEGLRLWKKIKGREATPTALKKELKKKNKLLADRIPGKEDTDEEVEED